MSENERDDEINDLEGIDGDEEVTVSSTVSGKNDLARPQDVLPGTIHLLPLDRKPFFPGQVLPLVIKAKQWGKTIRAVKKAGHGLVGLLFSNGVPGERATAKDFARVGTVCRIHQIERHDEDFHVVLAGIQRFRLNSWVSEKPPLVAQVQYFPELKIADNTQIKAYTTAIVNIIKELLPLNPMYGEELKLYLNHFGPSDPARLADFGASLTTADPDELQDVLDCIELLPRMEKTLVLLQKELEVAKAQDEIRAHVEGEIQSHQREAFLREQLKFIQQELGISKDDRAQEIETFRKRLDALSITEEVSKRAEEELEKLSVLERSSPEYNVTRNYLEWLTNIPFGKYSDDAVNLQRAERVLNSQHEGLADVKQRILEFIGVGVMKGEIAGSILLLVGPPGVGKTSLGRSIADSINRQFYRFSLGGMRDEAEIKGHRRTYIGAMPGKFVQALRDAETANPVIMLDEIDKIGASFQGDPASALLEVLDPEQNVDFLDHYLDVRVDLSKVLFVCTANQLDTIPGPLLDRMEIIHLSGYLSAEKVAIAKKHLLSRQLERVGLRKKGDVVLEKNVLKLIVERYAREAGVRKLDKLLGRIARKAVMLLLDKKRRPIKVNEDNLSDFLGPPIFNDEDRLIGEGVITGLAWTAMGGATLDIEATRIHEQGRGLKLTGQLGNVMQESAEIALSYITANAAHYGVPEGYFDKAMLHLHVPAGATPKDGPSAGITMAAALLSLAKQKQVRGAVAMTGELSLTGAVLPVGGIREKLLAAKRMGIKKILLPAANERDHIELPDNVKRGLQVHFVSRFDEVAKLLKLS